MTPGYHWFVAWRYLMARPRRVSAAVVAVATLLFITSGAVSLFASQAIAGAPDVGFTSYAAYRHTLGIAIGLLSVAAIMLLLVAASHILRNPERLAVPVASLVGWAALAVGLVAVSAEDEPTRTVGLGLIFLGAVCLAHALVRCVFEQGRGAWNLMALAGLLAGAGGAALAIARYAVAPIPALDVAYRSDMVLLPGLGLLVLGTSLAVAVAVVYAGKGRIPRVLAMASAIVLLCAALFPVAARALLSEAQYLVYDPPSAARHVQVWWAGVVIAGVAVLWALLALLRMVLAHKRPSLVTLAVWLAMLMAGGLVLLVAELVLRPPDSLLVVPVGEEPDIQGPLLVAVATLALGELTVMLGLVRYLFTFFTTVSIAGVAVGSMALVIVLSVMSGFETDLRNKILGSNAHVLITMDEGTFHQYREIAAMIKDVPNVVATTPYLTSEVVIAANNNYSNVIIKGVDPATVGQVTELDENAAQPDALERLWPLADDGGVLGPPTDAGVGQADGGAEQGRDAAGPGNLPDPPPPDMAVGIDEPMDMSGGGAGQGSDGTVDQDLDERPDNDNDLHELDDHAGPTGQDSGEDEGQDSGPGGLEDPDPPPADMDVAIDEPMDMSGGVTGQELDEELDDEDEPDEPDDEPGGDDVVIRPFDPDTMGGIFDLEGPDIRMSIPARVARLPGVLVGKELVKQIHLYVGQEVRIVSPLAEDTPAGPVPRTRFLRVAEVFYSGMYEYDYKFVYVPLPVLQSFLDLGDQVTGIEVRVTDPDETEGVLRELRERLFGAYRVQDWKEINRSLFSALKLEKIAMFLVLAIIILVASFSIVGNLVMVVVEKAKEIALLKTLGSNNIGVMQIFIAQGFFIGLVGTFIGVLHGLTACTLGVVYGLPIDPEVYYIDRLPIHVETNSVVLVGVAGVLISVVATLYPAYVGARLRPVEGLRYE